MKPMKAEFGINQREHPKKVKLYLIKPSSYDDEGYVVRYYRGVLPSNTLACLSALTQQACTEGPLRDICVRTHLIDESVMKVDSRRICRSQRNGSQTIVGLVGVQTHQFPRASDLAKQFRAAGLTVIIGGFHVSGQMAMCEGISPEISDLIELGVIVVQGEVEEAWGEILVDAIYGRARSRYDFIDKKPGLDQAPIPVLENRILKRFTMSRHGTIDCGRGCPYNCSFCTIINVQGRKMRFRSPDRIIEAIRENYRRNGVLFYFFTDDNFARNKNWEVIFDALIQLREREAIPIEFMMQVDVLSYRIKGFLEKARRAGCSNVFIGMESLNDDNLRAAGKRQNRASDFANLVEAYRAAEIATHVGYILGFPFDTPDSIRSDLETLMYEIGVDMASFFILTPLPGSQDHRDLSLSGAYMDPDLNKYDSQHETMEYPYFPTPGSLKESYEEAWRTFYSFENLSSVLRRAPKRCYWNLFGNFLWYKSAALIEKRHPMMAGFFRLKGRKEMRPGTTPLPMRDYYVKRVKEVAEWIISLLQLLLEMQLLWQETRHKSETEQRVLEELQRLRRGDSFKSGLAEIQAAYARARNALPHLRVPSRFRLFVRKWNPFSAFSGYYSPRDVLDFWRSCVSNLKRGHLTKIPPTVLLTRLLQDLRLSFHFAAAWMRKSGAN
jgi:radical SAM superfamily enzyme YgiQ (UPF0313 family)